MLMQKGAKWSLRRVCHAMTKKARKKLWWWDKYGWSPLNPDKNLERHPARPLLGDPCVYGPVED
jgi:hypothetical protein